MEVFFCGCCTQQLPTIHRNIHHKLPRSLGGRDTPDNLIELCPGCHDSLHAIAHKLLNKKVGREQILDSLSLIFPGNKKAQETCLGLALNVRTAMVDVKEKGLGPNHIVAISTNIRKYFKAMIQTRCRELNLSQESYLRKLVIDDLAKKYHLNVNILEENRLLKNLKKEKSTYLER